jgi:hypothetical protein
MSLRAYFTSAFYKLAPSWLTSGAGEKVLASLMLVADDFSARAKLGLLARFPQYAPDDALPALGRDRRILRGIGEPAAAYAERLTRALDDLPTRGNPFALLRQLRAYLQADCVVRTVDRRGNWFTIDANGVESTVMDAANWDWDGGAGSSWSRFWVIIYPEGGTNPWAPAGSIGDPTLYGNGDVGNAGYTVGTTATRDQVAAVRAIIRDWKPAGTVCEWIIIAFDAATFTPAGATDPNGEWGSWGNSTGSPIRLSSARYWEGVKE